MKLYEIDNAIEELMCRMDADPETGELPKDYDAMEAELKRLCEDRNERMTWIAKEVLNIRAKQDAIKNEIKRLQGSLKSACNR